MGMVRVPELPQTGKVGGQRISRSDPDLRNEFVETLLDLREDDIGDPGFAVMGTAFTLSSAAMTCC